MLSASDREKFPIHIDVVVMKFVSLPSHTGAGDVWFSLNSTIYRNNSIMILEDIGEGGDGLVCMTNYTACCGPPYTGVMGSALGNWFFPNRTRVPSKSGQWDLFRTRAKMVVHMNRRRGGEEGIYRCEIPDVMGVIKNMYIGVYSASSGEWSILLPNALI